MRKKFQINCNKRLSIISNLKGWLLPLLLILVSSPARAQLILDFSPKGGNFPREIIKLEQTRHSAADVKDTFQLEIGDSTVSVEDQTATLDIGFLYYSKKNRKVTFEGFDNTGDTISTSNYYSITRKDLPEKLYKDYGYIGLPIFIGDSRLNLYYGQLTVSDGKDLSDEDIIRYVNFEYYLTPLEQQTWVVGWYYTEAFGGIYNVPFLGYLSEGDEILAVQIVFPVKWSVGAIFQNGWILGIGQQLEGEAFRLTEEDPWNSAIVSFTGVRSTASIGFHFQSGWYLRIEGGSLTQQKIDFYDDSISISSEEVSEENYLSDDIPLLEMSLDDTTFWGIRLSWAF